MNFKNAIVLVCVVMCGIATQAQIATDSLDGRVNTINTAVPFLRIDPEARSGAMGDAGIALSPDANSIYWNTAKLSFAENQVALAVTYTPWLRELVNDIYLADLSGYVKLDDMQALTGSLRYFSLGSIQFTDISGNNIGQFNPHEFALDAGYSRKLSENFATGINLKFVYSNLAAGYSVNGALIKPGKAAAADISFFYHQPNANFGNTKGSYNIGMTISNLGSKITYTSNAIEKDYIPTNLGIGGAINFDFDDYNKLCFTTDINKMLVPTPDTIDANGDGVLDYKQQSVPASVLGSFTDAPGGFKEEMRELMYSVGAEYWYNNLFAVRAGYYNEHATKGNRKYLTAGLGIKYSSFGLNFSYLIPTNNQKSPLDNTLRFSLLFDFDSLKNTSAPVD